MVSVIIPTTIGGLVHIAGLMPNLSREPNTEIIVIDNNSRDGTCNYLSQYDCTIKVNKVNQSFSRSNNQGGRLAHGDYIMLLNNDTEVAPGIMAEMVNTFSIDPKIGVVGCLIYKSGFPRKVQHAGVCFTDDYVPYELGLPIPSIAPGITVNDPRVSATREVPSVTAAAMMIKRSVWEELNGLDEGYIYGWEDTDFVLRVRERGYKIWYCGTTHIIHRHFGSQAQGRFKFESQNRSRYDSIWVTTKRAQAVLGDFRQA